MEEILVVAFSGALGATIRYYLTKKAEARGIKAVIITGFINIIGSFLLGFIGGLIIENQYFILLLSVFCSSFTTYSTLMVEYVFLRNSKGRVYQINFIIIVFILGVFGATLGNFLAEYFC